MPSSFRLHCPTRNLIGLLALVLAVAIGARGGAAESPPPNIVMIISDDQAWTDYGFMGHETIQTPNLDRLASQSVVFTRGHVPTALCRPSLMTLITGLYAYQHGVTGNDPSTALAPANSPTYGELRERLISKIDALPTTPKLLTARGYVSHQSGKWWEGNYRRGGFTAGMTRGFPEPGGRHGDDGLKIGRTGLQPILQFVDQALADKKPFFLWYAPMMPHTPHTPPQRLLQKYEAAGRPEELAKYYAMCEWFDETCGELIAHLETKQIRDNTLIVYVTDNGWIQRTGETKFPSGWNQAFAPKSKQSPFDGGTRTPIMFSWPAKIKPARRDELVSSIDIVPTLLSAANVMPPDKLPGLNLLPTLCDGQALERDALFGETYAHDVADIDKAEGSLLFRWCLEGRWKLLLSYDGESGSPIVHAYIDKRPQLYDLVADPHEEVNLAAGHPDIVARLAQRLDDWYQVRERKAQVDFEPK